MTIHAFSSLKGFYPFIKKFSYFFAAVLFVGISTQTALQAQEYDKSIGLRYGSTKGVSFKGFMNEATAFEGMVVYHRDGFRGIALIEQHISPGRNSNTLLYAGIGGYAGVTALLDEFPGQNNVAGLTAIIGFEYVLPRSNVSFAFDLNPAYELIQDTGLSANQAAVSLRYLID
ncbi:MAG: hypothetical protein AAF696_09750 [Bacteroidota bacterium]